MTETLVRDVVTTEGARVDVEVRDGTVFAVSPYGRGRPCAEILEGHGRVVIPGLVESHLHLDKAHLGAAPGGLAEAIARTARLKAGFTVADVRERALRVVLAAVSSGTTAIRAHTEVDPTVGLIGVEAIDEVRASSADLARVQLAVFPQEGIEARPGTLALMRDALTLDDVVVGGCPYVEADLDAARRHIDTVLDLAVKLGVPADLHLDFADSLDDPRFALATYLAEAVTSRGLEGRVAIGHATSLSVLSPSTLGPTLEALAAAQVTVTVLPATDLHLMGRDEVALPTRGLAPVRALWAAGVPTALSSNNVRNAFTPSGQADLLDIALLLARVMQVESPADLGRVLAMATTGGASVLDPGKPVGLVPGARADLVLLAGTTGDELLLDQPGDRLVIHDGRPVVDRTSTTNWLAPAEPADLMTPHHE